MVTATRNTEKADALIRTAHGRVYRYPDTFEGFVARLTWHTDQASGAGAASLDLGHQEQVMRIARGVADGGGGVVVVAHDLNLAAAYADRMCLLHEGRVATTGAPWAALQEPLLADVFGQRMRIMESPGDGAPLVVPERFG